MSHPNCCPCNECRALRDLKALCRPLSQEEVGARLGLTKQRVQQIEEQAIKKLRKRAREWKDA